MNPSSFKARVLNAFHDLHASMTTSFLPPAAAAAFLAGAGTSVTALRFAVFLVIAFLGAMRASGCVRARRFPRTSRQGKSAGRHTPVLKTEALFESLTYGRVVCVTPYLASL